MAWIVKDPFGRETKIICEEKKVIQARELTKQKGLDESIRRCEADMKRHNAKEKTVQEKIRSQITTEVEKSKVLVAIEKVKLVAEKTKQATEKSKQEVEMEKSKRLEITEKARVEIERKKIEEEQKTAREAKQEETKIKQLEITEKARVEIERKKEEQKTAREANQEETKQLRITQENETARQKERTRQMELEYDILKLKNMMTGRNANTENKDVRVKMRERNNIRERSLVVVRGM